MRHTPYMYYNLLYLIFINFFDNVNDVYVNNDVKDGY
jgi:hypothetical protein